MCYAVCVAHTVLHIQKKVSPSNLDNYQKSALKAFSLSCLEKQIERGDTLVFIVVRCGKDTSHYRVFLKRDGRILRELTQLLGQYLDCLVLETSKYPATFRYTLAYGETVSNLAWELFKDTALLHAISL